MARVGDRYKTGETCETSGNYVFDGYTEGPPSPQPSQEERVIPLHRGHPFPPIRTAQRSAYWKLQRVL